MPDKIVRAHGGYRELAAYQMAEIVLDGTVAFTRLYLPKGSRTIDQMVQAARSGKQNVAEGSQRSGTSSKSEITLIDVATGQPRGAPSRLRGFSETESV